MDVFVIFISSHWPEVWNLLAHMTKSDNLLQEMHNYAYNFFSARTLHNHKNISSFMG